MDIPTFYTVQHTAQNGETITDYTGQDFNKARKANNLNKEEYDDSDFVAFTLSGEIVWAERYRAICK